jgi:uncharacterized damage-inducible protein DinB
VRKSDIATLFDYLYWMRDRILEPATKVSPVVFNSPSNVTSRNLRGTLVHEMDVEWSWRERLRGSSPDAWGPEGELNPSDFPSVAAVAEHWRRDEKEMRDWLDGLTDKELSSPAKADGLGDFPLWFYLMHVVSHGIQQLSDAATLLSESGQSPGDLEFLGYADSLSQKAAASRQGQEDAS